MTLSTNIGAVIQLAAKHGWEIRGRVRYETSCRLVCGSYYRAQTLRTQALAAGVDCGKVRRGGLSVYGKKA